MKGPSGPITSPQEPGRLESTTGRVVASFTAILVALLVVLAVFTVRYATSLRRLRSEVETQLQTGIDVAGISFSDAIDTSADDLRTLIGIVPVSVLLGTADEATIAQVNRIALQMIVNKDEYDQVRLIDAAGTEIIRADRDPSGAPRIATVLSDKSARPYVQRGLSLQRGQIYVSALDLNIEQGEVEKPEKPVLRTVVPIFAGSRIAGIGVTNILAEPLISRMVSEVSGRTDLDTDIYLLDQMGHFIYSEDEDLRWSHLLGGEGDDVPTAGSLFPELWDRLTGAVTDPGVSGDIIVSAILDTEDLLPGRGVNNPQHLTLAVQVPGSEIRAIAMGGSGWDMVTYALLFVVIAVMLMLLWNRWLSRRQQERELREAAFTDALTGYLNRRSFELMFHRELARLKRAGGNAAFVLFDIDRFKLINDTYGHTVGDVVLREVAERLQSLLRETDYAARWGGEEFALLLIDAPEPGGFSKARELHSVVGRDPIRVDDEELHVTVSGGVVTVDPAKSDRELFDEADRLLYLAKRAGRDRVLDAEEAARANLR